MKNIKKGFTLIELIVVMAIIAILVLIAAPKFMGYTEKAKLTQVINDINVSEKAAEQYYLQHDAWPRDQLATAYTDEQLTLWVDDFRNLSGETVTLEDGKYYDVDWDKLTPFMSKPENDFKYIIQNPVGDIYYVNDLTPDGEQTKFAGDTQTTTEPIVSVESITITAPKTSINVGETLQLSASVLPENATNKTITWSSSNTSLATVDSTGLVTSIGKGNVIITALSRIPSRTFSIEIVESSNIITNKLAIGNSHTLVIDENGQLWSFGQNRYGQLGHTTNIGNVNANSTPTKIMIGIKVVSVTAGNSHTLAIDENGQLWSFGRNDYGQLGHNTNIGSGNATPNPTPTKIMIGTKFVSVSAGAYHTLAIDETGQLWSFGYNQSGQLGHTTNSGTVNVNSTPTQIMIGTKVISVGTGAYYSLALDETGQLWSFGRNDYGQLGHNTNIGTDIPTPTPTKIMIGTKVISVTAGGQHTLAIDENSQFWSFGRNDFGQLGHTNNNGTSNPNSTPTKIMIGTKVVSVSAGAYYSLALDETGQLWSFGYNRFGQLGHNTNSGNATPNPTSTKIMIDTKIISVGSGHGASHTLAIDENGQLWSFGYNNYGQLGHAVNSETTNPNPTPTQIMNGISIN